MDIQIHKEAQPSSRPIMQMTVLVGDKDFTLFVNHWKSKSGGEEETEINEYLDEGSDFIQLVHGKNTFTYAAAAGRDYMNVTITYRFRYLGV